MISFRRRGENCEGVPVVLRKRLHGRMIPPPVSRLLWLFFLGLSRGRPVVVTSRKQTPNLGRKLAQTSSHVFKSVAEVFEEHRSVQKVNSHQGTHRQQDMLHELGDVKQHREG